MTAFSTAYPGGNIGPHLPHPKFMFRRALSSVSIVDSSTEEPSTGGNFFAALGERGTAVETNFSAATPKQILNRTGSGVINAIIGPLTASGSTTIDVTVDDDLWSFTYTHTGTRLVLYCGGFGDGDAFSAAEIVFRDITASGFNGSTGVYTDSVANPGLLLLPHPALLSFGTPQLYYGTSIDITMTTSAAQSTSTNRERSCGVQHRILS